MSIKAGLYAWVIVASFGACRGDRTSEERGFGRPVEGTDQSAETTRTNEAGHTVHETGAGMGAGVESGPSHASDFPVDEAGTENANTGADVTTGREVQGRRTYRATRGFTMGFGSRYSGAGTQAEQTAPATTDEASTPPEPGTPQRDAPTAAPVPATPETELPPPLPPTPDQDPASGLNETSSGHGTTTNTGTNTENAGNGNTDNPRQ
jgi:hypothetical protein